MCLLVSAEECEADDEKDRDTQLLDYETKQLLHFCRAQQHLVSLYKQVQTLKHVEAEPKPTEVDTEVNSTVLPIFFFNYLTLHVVLVALGTGATSGCAASSD